MKDKRRRKKATKVILLITQLEAAATDRPSSKTSVDLRVHLVGTRTRGRGGGVGVVERWGRQREVEGVCLRPGNEDGLLASSFQRTATLHDRYELTRHTHTHTETNAEICILRRRHKETFFGGILCVNGFQHVLPPVLCLRGLMDFLPLAASRQAANLLSYCFLFCTHSNGEQNGQ